MANKYGNHTEFSSRMKVNRTLLLYLLWAGIFLSISSLSLSESVTCDGVQCKEGSCVNGTCHCNYGWKGESCDHCSGRVLLTDSTGFVTDGIGNYSVDNKCTWLLDTGQANSSIQLKFHQFSTECGWDHVYVYDGDSVFSPLLAAYSGLIKQKLFADDDIPIITARSGKAFIYFYSDAAYNMSGFNLSYSVNTCQENCSQKGLCVDGRCQCQTGYTGDFCEVEPCPNNCSNNGQCVQNVCQCSSGFIGKDCSARVTDALWETTSIPSLDIGLASSASTLMGDYIYIAGGYSFIPNPSFLSRYHPLSNEWKAMTATGNTQPAPRYGHTLVGYRNHLYMFGGVVGQDTPHISRNLYVYNINTSTWNVSTVENKLAIPVAVAGHTAHIINGIMYVIFGHSPIYGYKNRIQEYNLVNKNWSIPRTSGAIVQGGYGHTSVYDPVTKMIYMYGGYHSDTHPNYQLTDQMYAFIPHQRKWMILRSNGSPRYLHSAAILNGLMFVFGGNTHNDTSISYGAKCYSSDLMVYNIGCNYWYPIQASFLPSFGARYGHSAVFYTLNNVATMFVIGGFNGVMQNNLIKFIPGNCSFYENKESCLGARQGVQCVWVSNSYCTSKTDANLDELGNFSEIEKCDSDQGKENICPKLRSCPSCLSSAFNCHWCNNNCTTTCAVKDKQSLISNISQCKDNPVCTNLHSCQACESLRECSWAGQGTKGGFTCRHSNDQDTPKDSDYSSETACEQPCYVNTNCENCTRSKCMWCANKRRCVETNSYVASFIYGQCMEWTTSENRCAATRCSDLLTCETCQSNPMCGWCNDPSNTGIGKCLEGGAVGPGYDPLNANNTQCPANRWFFTQCPACQCNGHSTCNNETGACESCQGMTTGEHCESCVDGYYGDPTNGGKCSVCECNGQANTCDNKTGVCFCRTRGVVGDKCEKCDVPHKYYGDPRNGGTCYYDLVTDYQFTFNLSKRDDKYYTQINFMNIPSSSDRDVDFKVNCSDDKAFLNISVRTKSKNEVIFVESFSCNYYRDKFEHQDYSFGSSENTTFLVYVYNFQTPFWLQISFSQFPKIDLLHFFVTFFSCFLSLLIIAAVLYKIKHKYDNYRRRQRMIVEMEEMASRPFSTVTLEIERKMDNCVAEKKDLNMELRKRKKINNKPSQVALEPLITQKAAVLTLLVQLPTGEDEWTPSGSSGVAIASALVTLGHHRKQSVEHSGKGDKNRFKKHSFQTHSDTCV